MKITIDIPERDLRDVLRFTGAATKRKAVVTALRDFNRRKRLGLLTKHLGASETFMRHTELMKLRRAK